MTVNFTTEIREKLRELLSRFERAARPGPFAYRWCHHFDGGQHERHIVFGCMVHGNEFGSLPAAVRLVEALNAGEIKFGGKVSIFIGNPEAARENRRYLEADLNRVFLHTGESRHEDRRAQQIMPILDAADVFVDFHQTILETAQPFYIFPWQHSGWQWARAIRSADVWVTRGPNVTFSSGSKCTDEYVSDHGRPGITVELSQKGFTDQAEQLCWHTMLTAMQVSDELGSGHDIGTLAERKADLLFYETRFSERFDKPEKALKPGLVNFQPVTVGEALHAPGSPTLTAPTSGAILFPKYPDRSDGHAVAPWPNEIYRLVAPLQTHPVELWEDPTES